MNTKLLRQKILDLAIRGKLTEQKKSDGTTKDLLAQISKQWLVSSKQDSQKENASSDVILERTSNVIANTTSTSSRTPIRDPFAASKNSDDVIAGTAKQSKKKTFAPKEIIPLDKSEAPFEIPENWEWVRLGDLMEKVGAGSTPTGGKKIYGTSGIKFIRSQNVHNDGLRLDDVAYIDPKIHEQKMHSQVVANDLLLNITGASIGRCAIVPNDFDVANINQHVLILRLLEKEMLGYVHTVVISNFVFSQIMSAQVGGTKEGLSAERAKALEIPLPPLAEQQRIVTAIESVFAEITAIENNQELLKKHIKQGRQKILDLAIRGRLTQQLKTDGTTKDLLAQISKQWLVSSKQESQKENASFNVIASATSTSSRTPIRDPFAASKNSDDVIASTAKQSKKKTFAPKEIIPLNKNEAPFEIPENWEWVRLGDVLADMKSTSPCGETFKYIDIDSIDNKRCVVKEPKVVSTKDAPSRASRFTKKGDVLFSLVRPYLRNIAKVEEDDCIASTGFFVCSPIHLNSDYCFYLMTSNYVVDGLNQFMKGDNSPSISSKNLQEWQIPLPPLAEQQRIVAAIESAFTEFDAMEKGIL